MLDLFSGTGSVGEVFRRHGYDVISLDNRAAAKPYILVDICDWNFRSSLHQASLMSSRQGYHAWSTRLR